MSSFSSKLHGALINPLYKGILEFRRRGGGSAPFDIASLFGALDEGVAFDLMDSSLLLQASGGAAVASQNDPIGYAADISGKGHHAVQATAANKPLWRGIPKELGAEVLGNGRFATDTSWTKGTGWSIGSSKATKTAGTAAALSDTVTLVAGQTYQLNYTMTRTAGTLTPSVTGGTSVAITARNYNGSYTEVFKAETGNTALVFTGDAAFAGTVSNVTMRPVTAMSNMGAWQLGSPRTLVTPAIDFTASDKLTVIVSTQIDQSGGNTREVAVGNAATIVGSAWNLHNGPPAGMLKGTAGIATLNLPAVDQAGNSGGIGGRDFVDCYEYDLAGATIADCVKITTVGVLRAGTSSGAVAGGGNVGNVSVTIGDAATRGITTRVLVINRILTSDEKAAAIAWARRGRVFACTLGDSTTAPLGMPTGNASRVSSLVGGMVTGRFALAEAGRKIADMKSAWAAVTEKTALQVVMIQIGLNDVKGRVGAGTATTADVIADLQDLIDTVNADKPSGCKVYVCGLTPCKVWLDAATYPADAYQSWLDVNDAIAGGGATPITGVDGRVTSHVAELNDSAGNLKAIYDYNSDGVHESDEARFIIAQAWRAQLVADGLLS